MSLNRLTTPTRIMNFQAAVLEGFIEGMIEFPHIKVGKGRVQGEISAEFFF